MENDEARERLALAVVALRREDKPEARRLLRALLSEDPTNIAAWYWACQAGDTPAEQRYCLNRLLELDPENEPARRYLAQLTPEEHPGTEETVAGTEALPPASSADPSEEKAAFSFKVTDLLWGPVAFLLQLPPLVLASLGLSLVLILGVIYYRANTSFFGLTTPDFANLRISEDCKPIGSEEPCWRIDYESPRETVFVGKVRHVSPIRLSRFPFLTHDILVTSGDFADPDKVDAGVTNHHFFWRSSDPAYPVGKINLLHTAPTNAAIYEQLLDIRSGDYVTITGQEILKVDYYDSQGQYWGKWQDSGCNTLRVTAVEIFSP